MLWRCWLGGRKGIRPVKNWVVGCWHGYLSGARCRLAYGPADATVTCFSKIQIGFTCLVPAHLGIPRKGPLNGCVWVCVRYMDGIIAVKWLWLVFCYQPNTLYALCVDLSYFMLSSATTGLLVEGNCSIMLAGSMMPVKNRHFLIVKREHIIICCRFILRTGVLCPGILTTTGAVRYWSMYTHTHTPI